MKKLIVLLDGFNPEDITEKTTPFLHSYKKDNNFALLLKSAPFCERSEFYSGANASETGNYFAFDLGDTESNYGLVKKKFFFCFKLADLLIDQLVRLNIGLFFFNRVKKKFRSIFLNLVKSDGNDYYSINHIPYKYLHYFSLTEDSKKPKEKFRNFEKSLFNQSSFKGKRILNLFDDLRVSITKESYENRLNTLRMELEKDNYDVYMIANSELDYFYHENGVEKNSSCKKKIFSIDSVFKDIHNTFIAKNPNGIVCFFSPHGMLRVDRHVNVEKFILSCIDSNKNQYFIDSTAFRIWGENLDEIFTYLKSKEELVKNGTFQLSSEFYTTSNRPLHILWFANTGVICFPDFFRRTVAPKGMHGYLDLRAQDGFLITNKKINKKEYYISELSEVLN